MRFKIIEAYLDSDNKFWDYNTKDITKWVIPDKLPLSTEIFDTSTLGGYSQYWDYLHDKKNIMYITANDYFEQCAKGFGNSFSAQVRQVENDREVLDHLRQVIFKYHKSFPMPYISKSNGAKQEGRHRVYIFAELYSWNKSFPCLILP